ncbi:2Fe-2S iron-sulfur cluster-binding protein [Micromonosporaceae bacterium Da 78-11]
MAAATVTCGLVEATAIGLVNVGPCPVRARAAEEVLIGTTFSDAAITAAAEAAASLDNGDRRDLDLEPHRTLGEVLREVCGPTSTRLGCTDGTCGGCTVLVDGEAIRSCLMLAVQTDGSPGAHHREGRILALPRAGDVS